MKRARFVAEARREFLADEVFRARNEALWAAQAGGLRSVGVNNRSHVVNPCRYLGVLLAAGLVPLANAASPEPAREQPLLREVAAAVSPTRLHATISRLLGFGTRHSLSQTRSDSRGIGAARRWVAARFAELSSDCGDCLELVTPSRRVTGDLDSRASDVMDFTGDAPGANDDASGVAAVMEAARVLSRHKFRATLVYGVLSGEEQGLYGGNILAEYARAQGWQVQAVINNDIIGNSRGADGVHDNSTVRVFSEGSQRRDGGEVDAPSRNIARFMATLAQRYLTNLRVQMVYRSDRVGRAGDQMAFLELGYPAVRVTEAHEDYRHQHQDPRVENGVTYGDTIEFVDFDYLAQVTRLNLVTLAALANAPAPPHGVAIAGAVTPHTTLTWQTQPAVAGYRVWWRATSAPHWQYQRFVAADAAPTGRLVLENLVIDDWFFGVSAVSADGYESPVVFPGAPGAFWPESPAAEKDDGDRRN